MPRSERVERSSLAPGNGDGAATVAVVRRITLNDLIEALFALAE